MPTFSLAGAPIATARPAHACKPQILQLVRARIKHGPSHGMYVYGHIDRVLNLDIPFKVFLFLTDAADWAMQARKGMRTQQRPAARASCQSSACGAGSCAADLRAGSTQNISPRICSAHSCQPAQPPATAVSSWGAVQHSAYAPASRAGHASPVLPRLGFHSGPNWTMTEKSTGGTTMMTWKAGGHPCILLPLCPSPACPSMKLCRSGPPQPRRLPMRCQARKAGPEKKPSRSSCVSPNCAHTRCHTASWPARHQRSLEWRRI